MMSTPEHGRKPDRERRLDVRNADAVHPAEPREQQLTEPRTIESPFESNSADATSGHVGKMSNEAVMRNESPLAGPAGERDPEVSRGTVNSPEPVPVGPKGIDELIQYRTRDLENVLNELDNSEADLRTIIDTIPALAWCNRPDGSIEFINQRWHEFTGLSRQEAYGWGWKTAIHPEDLPRLMEKWGALRDLDKPGEWEVRLRRSDGVFRWFLFRREPLRDQTGAVVRWYVTAADIEDLKRTESLGGAEKRLLGMIANGVGLSEVLNDLCAAIDDHATGATSFVCLMDEDGKQLLPCAGPRVPAAFTTAITPFPIGPNRGSCGTAAFTKRRVIIADVSSDPKWPEEIRELALTQGVHAAWSEPLISKDGDVLGTFCVSYGEPRTPDTRDLELIEAAGNVARIAIERQRSQKALRGALDEIRSSEAKLRQIIDTIPALVWWALPDGSKEFLNKYWRDYTGLSAEQSHGWGWQIAIHPEDLPDLMGKWQELGASGERGEMEARVRRRDGTFRWFLIRIEPLCDETGKIIRWYGTSADIEVLKQTEVKLREDERELRRITDAIPQTIVVQDPSGVSLYANQATLDYTGLTIEDVLNPSFRERIFHPDDIERLRDERKAALARGFPFEIEQRARRKDGQYRWFLIRYNPFRDEQGRLMRWYATGTDIDDRVKAEERTRNENLALREQIDRDSMFEDIVGSSEALGKVLRQVAKVAPSDSTVLILGETGTGKELIARAIHKRSKRAERAFIGVNCAAIPPSLIASELFGYEKGAFTGATQRRLGRFESANGGTMFLDEVGDLPQEIQIALLRVLQEREIERVGGNKPIAIDVRVLAATHRDLSALVAEGTFRQDLLYRLNVVPIEMPSLCERADDIPLLVEYFIDRFGKKAGKKFRTIDKRTLKLFQAYDWPGNVRELQNVIERAVILSDGDAFSVDETWLKREPSRVAGAPTVALNGALFKQEKEMIEAALRESHGRVSGAAGAAAKLGIPARTLDSKIKRLGINIYRFKAPER
jgi:formate hydrogenlyase transcriptional activator